MENNDNNDKPNASPLSIKIKGFSSNTANINDNYDVLIEPNTVSPPNTPLTPKIPNSIIKKTLNDIKIRKKIDIEKNINKLTYSKNLRKEFELLQINSPRKEKNMNDKIQINEKNNISRLTDKINIMTYSHNYNILSSDIEKILKRIDNIEKNIENENTLRTSLLKLYEILNEKVSKLQMSDNKTYISKCIEIIKLNKIIIEKYDKFDVDRIKIELETKNKKIEELYIRIKILESKTPGFCDIKEQVLGYLDDYDIILKRKEIKINNIMDRLGILEDKI